MEQTRVITMIPSATEIVCALGREDSIIARSHECDYPKSISQLPVCTETRIDTNGSSREIDNQVKLLVEEGLSVYRVDANLLKEYRPDVIITQTQCEVCAVSPKDLELAVSNWIEGKPNIVSLEPNELADVWLDIQKVADALGASSKGEMLVQDLIDRMDVINRKVLNTGRKTERKSPGDRQRVVCVEWIDPLMAAGNWIPELVEMAGGDNVFSSVGKHSPWITWDALCKADPDVIVVMPCGYDIQESLSNMSALTSQSGWSKLKAVIQNKVYIVDGNQYFNRPGPRLVESLEIMAELVNPELFQSNFSHKGTGWEVFPLLQG